MAASADVVAAMAMSWGDCLVPPGTAPADLVAAVRRSRGGVPEWVPRFGPLPWLVRAMHEMTSAPLAYLPVRDFFLLGLVVSRDNSCRFCYGAQRALMRVLGFDVDVIDRLERDQLVDADPARQLALDFARKVSRGSPRPGAAELGALARSGRSKETVAELAFGAAAVVFANRASTMVALPASHMERAPFQIAGRLLRPIIARRATRQRPPAAPPTPNEGVGAAVVTALGTSPAAGVLRRTIDEALDSPVLPRRTKLLMLGVIARALQCARTERDVVTALTGEGMAADDVAQALDHLASPALAVREGRLLPFARETVRCQPAEIQPRLRALATDLGLGVPELLEVVGISAVGNTLCRASIVLEQC